MIRDRAVCLGPQQLLEFSAADQAGVNVYSRAQYVNVGNQLSQLTTSGAKDAVCSVCQTGSTTQFPLTVHGRNDCPTDFVLDYKGYIMAESFNRFRTEFICMDSAMEAVACAGCDANKGALYPTETEDSLQGYTDGMEVTCAQCSSSAGPTYVRWGRSTCPAAATLVYAGRAAGADGMALRLASSATCPAPAFAPRLIPHRAPPLDQMPRRAAATTTCACTTRRRIAMARRPWPAQARVCRVLNAGLRLCHVTSHHHTTSRQHRKLMKYTCCDVMLHLQF